MYSTHFPNVYRSLPLFNIETTFFFSFLFCSVLFFSCFSVLENISAAILSRNPPSRHLKAQPGLARPDWQSVLTYSSILHIHIQLVVIIIIFIIISPPLFPLPFLLLRPFPPFPSLSLPLFPRPPFLSFFFLFINDYVLRWANLSRESFMLHGYNII